MGRGQGEGVERRIGEFVFNGDRVLVQESKNFRRWMMVSVAMWRHLAPLNCAVKYSWDSLFYIMWLLPQRKHYFLKKEVMTFNGGFVMISGYNSKCQGKIHLFKDPLRVCFCSLLEILFPLFSALFWVLGNGTLRVGFTCPVDPTGLSQWEARACVRRPREREVQGTASTTYLPTPSASCESSCSWSGCVHLQLHFCWADPPSKFPLENRLWSTQWSLLVPSGLGGQWLPHSCHSQGAPSLLTDSFNSA